MDHSHGHGHGHGTEHGHSDNAHKEHKAEDHGGHDHDHNHVVKKKKKTHNLSLVSSVGFTIEGLFFPSNIPTISLSHVSLTLFTHILEPALLYSLIYLLISLPSDIPFAKVYWMFLCSMRLWAVC